MILFRGFASLPACLQDQRNTIERPIMLEAVYDVLSAPPRRYIDRHRERQTDTRGGRVFADTKTDADRPKRETVHGPGMGSPDSRFIRLREHPAGFSSERFIVFLFLGWRAARLALPAIFLWGGAGGEQGVQQGHEDQVQVEAPAPWQKGTSASIC